MAFPAGFDSKAASDAGAFVEAAYATYLKNRTSETPPVIGLPPNWQLAAWVTMTDHVATGFHTMDLEVAHTATPTVVVAHSLGAALASLYVLDNAAGGHSVAPTLYTYASPRVGDQAFVDAFKATKAPSWRIENAPDIVPDAPPDSLGYRHLDTQVLIDSTGKVNSSESCFHAMRTHRHLLDPSVPLDAGCEPGRADEVMLVP